MANKIGAGIAALAGFGLIVLALGSSASAIPGPKHPGVAWLADLPGGTPQKAPPALPIQTRQGSPSPSAAVSPKPPSAALPPAAAAPQQQAPAAAAPKPEAAPAISRGMEAAAKPAAPSPAQAPVAPQTLPAVRREPAKPEPVVARANSPGAFGPAPARPESVKLEPAKPEPGAAKPEVAKPEAGPTNLKAAEVMKPAPKTPEGAPPEEEEGTGTLSIASEPPGAEVFLDGASVGQTPIEIDVPAGLHKVRLAQPGGGIEKRQNVHVKTGRTAEVRVGF